MDSVFILKVVKNRPNNSKDYLELFEVVKKKLSKRCNIC